MAVIISSFPLRLLRSIFRSLSLNLGVFDLACSAMDEAFVVRCRVFAYLKDLSFYVSFRHLTLILLVTEAMGQIGKSMDVNRNPVSKSSAAPYPIESGACWKAGTRNSSGLWLLSDARIVETSTIISCQLYDQRAACKASAPFPAAKEIAYKDCSWDGPDDPVTVCKMTTDYFGPKRTYASGKSSACCGPCKFAYPEVQILHWPAKRTNTWCDTFRSALSAMSVSPTGAYASVNYGAGQKVAPTNGFNKHDVLPIPGWITNSQSGTFQAIHTRPPTNASYAIDDNGFV